MKRLRRYLLLGATAVIALATAVVAKQCLAQPVHSIEQDGYRYSTVYVDSQAELGAVFARTVPGSLLLGLHYPAGAGAERLVGTVGSDGSKQRVLHPVAAQPGQATISVPATQQPCILIYRRNGGGFTQRVYFFESEAERSRFAPAARITTGAEGAELWQLGGFCDLSDERIRFAGYDEADEIADGAVPYEPLFGPAGQLALLLEPVLQADGNWSGPRLVRVSSDLGFEVTALDDAELLADTFSNGRPSKAAIAADGSVLIYSHASGEFEPQPGLEQLGRALIKLNKVQHGGLTSTAILPDGFALYSLLDAPRGYATGSVDSTGRVTQFKTAGHAFTASGMPRLDFWIKRGSAEESRRASRARFRREGLRQPPTTHSAASVMAVIDAATAAIIDPLYQRVTFVSGTAAGS